jgi:soluble lytic murein transglycosylase
MVVALAAASLSAQGSAPEPVWPLVVRDPWHMVAEWSQAGRAPSGDELVRLAAAELAVGRLSRARQLLARPGAAGADTGAVLALRAALADAVGAAAEAAVLYERAAQAIWGRDLRRSAALLARGAAASERGGAVGAADRYARARALLPEIGGWLALREAALRADPVVAERLLALAPDAARPVALAALADIRVRSGDTAAAERLLAEAGRPDRAATLALTRGDTARARAYAVSAVSGSDTAVQRAGLSILEGAAAAAPGEERDWSSAAAAAARLGEVARAARLAARGVAAGDSGPGALVRWGGYLERAGRRSEALLVYARAGSAGDYPRARALLQSGDRAGGVRALRGFADATPDDPQAPLALYLAAEAARSDSLLAAVATRWPAHEYAARARQRLALDHLLRHDTAGALRYFEAGASAGASDAPLANFHAGRLRMALGDPVGQALLETLAQTDSVGYYGFQARAALGLPPPRFEPISPHPPAPGARALLDELASLEAAGLDDEANLLVTYAGERGWDDANELLDVAEGLTAAGRPVAGIRLGWRAATRLTLNHPRVVRAVFPWPERDLIEREAEKFNLDPYLVAGLIRQESGFAAAVRSRAGAVGAMQLMPATARVVARRLRVPWTDAMRAIADANIHVGTAHLAGLVARYQGDLIPAIAAYNAGGTPVSRWLRAPGAADRQLFVERIGYSETQGYVRTVWRNWQLYRALYGANGAPGVP